MSEPVFRLYDTMTKQVKPLTLREAGHLHFYTCGPTVYSYAHIGNFRSFLTSDLIVRTARAIGWKVTWVSNITDVGHLTQDDMADAGGEDKMERALKSKEGEQFNNVYELAEYYTAKFLEDWRALNLVEPDVRPKATQHVREQILAAESLIKSGNAYETPTGVYFSVESFPKYGELSGNSQEELFSGVRDIVLDDNKRQQADFALWKKDDRHLMQWYSPFGWGFPGWHIECSAMARRYLGDTLDLHSGGEDNIFPHHECEIAQSESLTGKPFCNHWVHTRFLQVNGKKMAKSAGNFHTVGSLMAKGYDPLAIRYALISASFTKQLNFTDQGIADADINIDRFRRADEAVSAALDSSEEAGEDSLGPELSESYEKALAAMLNDLNTSVALAEALDGTKKILREGESLNVPSARSGKLFLDRMNDLLGVVRHDGQVPITQVPELDLDVAWVLAKIEERAAAKKAKDFATADAIRAELALRGAELRDSPEGTTWHLIRGTQ
jgi:cysteinyl-tRNA synthetase